MKNKNGVFGALFLLFLFLILIGAWFSSTNPQKSFSSDCERLYKDDFLKNGSCLTGGLYSFFKGNLSTIGCEKTDREALEKYCLDKYTSDALVEVDE